MLRRMLNRVHVRAAKEEKAERCLVLQFHDTAEVPFPGLRQWNECYASRHGYDYKLHTGEFEDGQGISPYWGKVKAVLENMARYDYILMLDTDAVVHDVARPMPSLVAPHKAFVYSGDSEALGFDSPFCAGGRDIHLHHGWRRGRTHCAYCMCGHAGVFLVRTCDKMRALFERWLSIYPASKWWKDETGVWVCKKGTPWAGSDYEQGAFVEHFLTPIKRTETECYRNRREFGHLLQPVSPRVLQSGEEFRATPESFTVHFAGEGKSEIAAYCEQRRKRALQGASSSVGLRHRK